MRPDRSALAAQYAASDLLIPAGTGWVPLTIAADAAHRAFLVITAANPWSLTLTPAINAARDRVLHAELIALGLAPQRVRAQAQDGTWHEDGWLVQGGEALAVRLMRRYQQHAVFVLHQGRRDLRWAQA